MNFSFFLEKSILGPKTNLKHGKGNSCQGDLQTLSSFLDLKFLWKLTPTISVGSPLCGNYRCHITDTVTFPMVNG